MRKKKSGGWAKRAGVVASVGIAILALVTVFQNCAGLDSPSATGSASTYSASVAIADVVISPGQLANVLVVLDRPLAFTTSVAYRTLNDSAEAGVHYEPLEGTLELAADQTSFQIAITSLVTSGADYTNKRFKVEVSFSGNVAPQTTGYITFSNGPSPGTLSNHQRSSNSGLLSTGFAHSCATKNDALYCWGENSSGQLGVGNAADRSSPGLVVSMESGVEAVAAGRSHTCAIRAGALYCWGLNSSYQLGSGTMTGVNFPQAVVDMAAGVQGVSSGHDHTCAIKAGALYCWGNNLYAQAGHNLGNQTVPAQVPNFTSGVTAVAAGMQYTCVIKAGALYCWGLNSSGQLGLGNVTTSANRNPTDAALTPVVGFESGVIAVATNDRTTCASKGAGALYCWGYNASGQLGLGNTTNVSSPNLINGFDAGVGHFASTVTHTCAIKASGLHCWGYNANGQLGNGTLTQATAPAGLPVSVTLNLGEQFVHVSAGGHGDFQNRRSHTCGRTNQNRVFCWGYNNSGQIGDNSTQQKLVPTLIGL